jgi:hypothetical protein
MFAASSIVNPDDANIPVLRNNLFYGGTLDLLPFGTSHSMVQDNLFDRTTILDHNPPCTYTGYNAYVTNCNRLQPTTTYNIILTNSLTYQTGPLGAFYQPTNSPLIDKGSESVEDAGLTGYTILTNQTPDTGTVDIGYHYSILSAPIACTTKLAGVAEQAVHEGQHLFDREQTVVGGGQTMRQDGAELRHPAGRAQPTPENRAPSMR